MRFEIIKNSESNSGYDIADNVFDGMKPGLLCGWQFEFRKPDGGYYYNSVAFEWEMPEEYINRWHNDYTGRSWIYDLLPDGYELTGRVIFRGYAIEKYDCEMREEYVEPISDEEARRW